MTNAAVNIGIHISFGINVLKFLFIRRGVVGSYGNSILNFWRNLCTVFHGGYTSLYSVPPAVSEGSSFFTTSPTLIKCFVDNSHSNRCEVVSHGSFDLHFPNS